MRERVAVLQEYAIQQHNELQRLQQVKKHKIAKMKEYRALNDKLNDQALHFEVMI